MAFTHTFTGPGTLIKTHLLAVIQLNEANESQAYRLSFAGNQSGLSFGFPQWDIGSTNLT